MVRKYQKRSNKTATSPSKMQQAVRLVTTGWSLRQAAEHRGVKRSSLFDMMKKVKEREIDCKTAPKSAFKTSIGHQSVFSAEQEKTIEEYCIQIAKMGYGLSVDKVRELAYEVAQVNGIKCPPNWERDKLAGIDWFQGFKKRHSNTISIRTPEACSIARAMAFNKPVVLDYFGKQEEVLSRHESFRDGSRVYNLDETSTSTVQNTRKLVSPKGCKQVHQIKSSERGVSVTTSVIIGAHGTVLPPVMIFPRKIFKSNMVMNAYPGTLGLANEKGYNTKETFIEILRHFIKCTHSSKDSPTLLLLDNVETHFSTDVLNLAKECGVVMFTFPPHCTHKLQPLDVGFFGPFKSYYDNAVNSFILSNPAVAVTIYHVAGFVKEALSKAAVPSTIINSFEKTGVLPFNRNIFKDSDFIMATVTVQPNPEDLPPTETNEVVLPASDESGNNDTNENLVPDRDQFVSPEALRGYPHAKPKTPTRKPRRKGKCMVATDTPEKNTISQREKEVKEKKERAEMRKRKQEEKEKVKRNKKQKSNRKKSTTRKINFGSSSDENELEEELSDEVDDVQEVNISKKTLPPHDTAPSEGDYVLVQFKSTKCEKYYIGKIIQEMDEDGDLQISYLRKTGSSFVMPNVPDLNSVHISDIRAIMPKPSFASNSTRRLQSIISFDFNFGDISWG